MNTLTSSGGGGSSEAALNIPVKEEPVVIQRLTELQNTVESLTGVVDTLQDALCRSISDVNPADEGLIPDIPAECHIAMRIREYQTVVDVQRKRIVDIIGRLEV